MSKNATPLAWPPCFEVLNCTRHHRRAQAHIQRTDADGSLRGQSTNYFGTPGGWVSATCDGVRGDLNPW